MSRVLKKELKRYIEFITWPFLRLILYVFENLPKKSAVAFIRAILYPFIKSRKRIAISNANLVFPNKDHDEIEKMVDNSIDGFLTSIWEILRGRRENRILDSFSFEGLGILDEVKGKGAIGIGIHLGNFPLMCAILNKMGYNVYPVMRRVHNKPLADFVEKLSREYGIRIIYDKPKQKATMEILRSLKSGGFVFLAMDQTASSDDIKIPFFGIPVPTFRGPVVLHYRTRAPLIPIYTYREGDKNKVVIEEPLSISGSLEEDLRKINETLERIIIEHPNDWFWFHRRWKRALTPKSLQTPGQV